MEKILLAGATGYLGKFIARELQKQGYYSKVIVRNPKRLEEQNIIVSEMIQAELTKPETIEGCCQDVDTVISSVGITRQKDGLTYMDVDYQANKILLEEAKKSGVRKFIYVSALNGEKLKHLKICEAKEKFVEELISSGLEYCIIRPNGFFSDIAEIYEMAKKGSIYLFGDGNLKSNPIHGEDLAEVCVEAINKSEAVIKIGGPETLTQNEISTTAFDVLEKSPKIIYIPDWIRKIAIRLVRTFSGSKTYGPIEFFLTVMSIEMVAPEYGKHTLKDFFKELKRNAIQ